MQAIDINTLGVLYVVENGDQVQSIADLKGKTLYLTGKGTTPDYVIQYLLKANGVTTDDVTLEYKIGGDRGRSSTRRGYRSDRIASAAVCDRGNGAK